MHVCVTIVPLVAFVVSDIMLANTGTGGHLPTIIKFYSANLLNIKWANKNFYPANVIGRIKNDTALINHLFFALYTNTEY